MNKCIPCKEDAQKWVDATHNATITCAQGHETTVKVCGTHKRQLEHEVALCPDGRQGDRSGCRQPCSYPVFVALAA